MRYPLLHPFLRNPKKFLSLRKQRFSTQALNSVTPLMAVLVVLSVVRKITSPSISGNVTSSQERTQDWYVPVFPLYADHLISLSGRYWRRTSIYHQKPKGSSTNPEMAFLCVQIIKRYLMLTLFTFVTLPRFVFTLRNLHELQTIHSTPLY
jgi:hypothetical protein